MDQPIRHQLDQDGYYNGSEGQWTICGLDWWTIPKPPGDATDCTECVRLRRQRLDRVKADWR